MMTAYILKLLLMVPLVGGLAYGALWMWRKVQPGMAIGQRARMVKIVDAVPMGATGRLAVVEFSGKQLLLAVSRGRIELLAEGAAVPAAAPVTDGD